MFHTTSTTTTTTTTTTSFLFLISIVVFLIPACLSKSPELQLVHHNRHMRQEILVNGSIGAGVARDSVSKVDNKPLEHVSHRYLPGASWGEFDIRKKWNELVSTPIRNWDWSEWLFLFILVFLMTWCCGICVRRRIRRQPITPSTNMPFGGGMTSPYHGYNNYNNNNHTNYHHNSGSMFSSGQQCCNCLRSAMMCFLCYELCCADCHDVPCFRHSSWSGNAFADSSYRRQEDGPGPEIV
jgi:hypothetical protein